MYQLADANIMHNKVCKSLNNILNTAARTNGSRKAASRKGQPCDPFPPSTAYSGMCFSFAVPSAMTASVPGADLLSDDEEVHDNHQQSPAGSALRGGRDEAAGLEEQQQLGQHSPAAPVHGSLAPGMTNSKAAALDSSLPAHCASIDGVSLDGVSHHAAQMVMEMHGYSAQQQYFGSVSVEHMYRFSTSEPVRTSGLIVGCEEDAEQVAQLGVCSEGYIDPDSIW
jgi:hypothetical protein